MSSLIPNDPDSGQFSEWIRWAIAGAFGLVGFFLLWLRSQLAQLKKEVKEDEIVLRADLVNAIKAVENMSTMQHHNLSKDVDLLRQMAEKAGEESSVERHRMMDFLSELAKKQASLPDRAEMQAAITSLKTDIAMMITRGEVRTSNTDTRN